MRYLDSEDPRWMYVVGVKNIGKKENGKKRGTGCGVRYEIWRW